MCGDLHAMTDAEAREVYTEVSAAVGGGSKRKQRYTTLLNWEVGGTQLPAKKVNMVEMPMEPTAAKAEAAKTAAKETAMAMAENSVAVGRDSGGGEATGRGGGVDSLAGCQCNRELCPPEISEAAALLMGGQPASQRRRGARP
eukprot:388122-Prymnesium_polylepis.1